MVEGVRAINFTVKSYEGMVGGGGIGTSTHYRWRRPGVSKTDVGQCSAIDYN